MESGHPPSRRRAIAAFAAAAGVLARVSPLLAGALAACGGGGGGDDGPAAGDTGTAERLTITGRATGTVYPIDVYLPPASDGPRSAMPVIYTLDGESWFTTLAAIADAASRPAIVVAIGGNAMRSRDYVPANSCTTGGGGHVAFLGFVRDEVLPAVESRYGATSGRRALFGHSHGGAFVIYAMFAETPGRHPFAAYLTSDASIGCMAATVADWEQRYADAHAELPVRLHVSSATLGNGNDNEAFARGIENRRFRGLVMRSQLIAGSHNGIVPAALADALAFAFPA